MSARGAVTGVGLALLLLVGAAGYALWMFVPVYAEGYEVKRIVREVANEAVKSTDDARLVEALSERLRRVGEAPCGPGARAETCPAVDVAPRDITWERVGAGTLHVAFRYDRAVPFPLLDRTLERVMDVDLTLDVALPRWSRP